MNFFKKKTQATTVGARSQARSRAGLPKAGDCAGRPACRRIPNSSSGLVAANAAQPKSAAIDNCVYLCDYCGALID